MPGAYLVAGRLFKTFDQKVSAYLDWVQDMNLNSTF